MSDRLCDDPRMNLNKSQFEDAVAHGGALCKQLKADYPELHLYPVLTRIGPKSGQCGLTTHLLTLLEEFPEMVIVSFEVERLGKLLRQLKNAKELKLPAVAEIQQEVDAAMILCRAPYIPAFYCGDVNIELRCGTLNFAALRRLQQDARLPPGLNTVGNIRVIVGSLEFLSKEV